MKKSKIIFFTLGMILLVACSSSDDTNGLQDCIRCAAYEFNGNSFPSVEVCKGTNGNSFINGVDSDISYDGYLSVQRMLTTCQ